MPTTATWGWTWVGVGALAGAAAALSARAGAECAYVPPDPDRAGLSLVSVTVDGLPLAAEDLAAYAPYTVTLTATPDGVDLEVSEPHGELVAVEVWE